jgi:hypothetical protein
LIPPQGIVFVWSAELTVWSALYESQMILLMCFLLVRITRASKKLTCGVIFRCFVWGCVGCVVWLWYLWRCN